MNLDSEAGEDDFEEQFTNSYQETDPSEDKNRPASGSSDG